MKSGSLRKHVSFLTRQHGIYLIGNKKGNVYVADFNSTISEGMTCLFSKADAEERWVWQRKLCHLNFKAINLLVKMEIVRGLPKLEFTKDDLCDECQKGKQSIILVKMEIVRGLPKLEFTKDDLCDECQKGKQSIKSKTKSSIDEPLQLLHMDLFGPVNIISINKKKYYLVIVDGFTRFSWTVFLHSKDEAIQFIINHVKVVDNGTKWTVKKIRSDNGTEFKNSTMKDLCNDRGITHTFSSPRTSQQNDVVERKNRTLIEAARSMLEESKFTTYFRAEVINTACYTQNISIVNQAQGKTPYQLMKNKKPTINFLCVFGCKRFVLRN